jgi:hypothetical protein
MLASSSSSLCKCRVGSPMRTSFLCCHMAKEMSCSCLMSPANQTHVVNRLRAHSVALDPVASITLAYCWVSSTLSNQSAPTSEDLLALFLPLTPGNSNHSMHSSHSGGLYLVLLLTIHSWDFHALTSPASSAGPCSLLLSRRLFTWSISITTTTDYRFIRFFPAVVPRILTWLLVDSDSHGLQFVRFIHVDHCWFFRLPRTLDDFLTWLLVHLIGLPRTLPYSFFFTGT